MKYLEMGVGPTGHHTEDRSPHKSHTRANQALEPQEYRGESDVKTWQRCDSQSIVVTSQGWWQPPVAGRGKDHFVP